MKVIPFLLILFFSLRILGQPIPGKSITGSVKDVNNEPVGGASVRLLKVKDSSLVNNEVTNGKGKFYFRNMGDGEYIVCVSGLGFKNYYSIPLAMDDIHTAIELPVIVLVQAKSVELKAVTVVSKKPLVEQDIDRTIVNVNSMISAATSNTLEVLEKTPGVTVDNNGNISLNGKSGILVLIDDRPTYMSGQDLAAYLKSLPGAILDKIELMDTPPAKYDAAGSAVINIRLKKNRVGGFTGNFSSSYIQGIMGRTYNALNLNYSRKKMNWFSNIGYNSDGNYSNDYSDRKFFNSGGAPLSRVIVQNNYRSHSDGLTARIGLDFSVSPKTILGLQLNGQMRPRTEKFEFESSTYDNLNVLDSVRTGVTNGEYGWNTKGINLNFQHKLDNHGKELSGDLNYINYHSSGFPESDNYSNTQQKTSFTNNIMNGIDIYSLKMDYTQLFKSKILLETGIKSSFVTNNNNSRYFDLNGNAAIQNFGRSNHFIYHENINGGYISLRKGWKRWGGQFGLRVENSRLQGNSLANQVTAESKFRQNFTDVFPSVFLNYKLDSLNKSSIGISFGSRISRPNYQQLNPFLVYRDQYSYTQGNPDLQPQYMQRLEIRYQFKQLLSLGLSYNHAGNLTVQANEARGDTFIYKPVNIARGQMFLMNSNLTFTPLKWCNTNLNVQVAHYKLRGILFTEKLNSDMTVGRVSINNQFSFKNGWSAELSGYYNSRDIIGQVYLKSRYRVWTAIQKKLWKDKGSVRLSLEDVFHSWVQSENSIAVKQSEFYHYNENDTQRAGIAFTYRFGSDKFARKRKQTENAADSEKGRVE